MYFINWLHRYTLGQRLTWLKSFCFLFFFFCKWKRDPAAESLAPSSLCVLLEKQQQNAFFLSFFFSTTSRWVHGDIKEATHSPSFSLSIFFYIFEKSTCTSGCASPRSARSPPPDTTELRFMPPCFLQTWHFLEARYAEPYVAFIFFWGAENYFHMRMFKNLRGRQSMAMTQVSSFIRFSSQCVFGMQFPW